jgi:hypothetical protein
MLPICQGAALGLRLHIPDNVVAILPRQWLSDDIPHQVLEDLVLQWQQDYALTEAEVRQTQGLEMRIQP